MTRSDIARALQKLSHGVPKTMTPEALEQRRQASKAAATARIKARLEKERKEKPKKKA